jgi:hypothetical protein
MWANYALLFMGGAIVVTMCWSTWSAFARKRIYLGRSSQKWLTKDDDPRRFRINVVCNLALIPFGIWMIALGLGLL